MPGSIVCVTGTPGTGKKSVAPLVARRLGLPCRSIDGMARAHGLLDPGSHEVDTDSLRAKLRRLRPGPSVVYGHLVPYAVPGPSVAKALVLRCEPSVLRGRLRSRGYDANKVGENVVAELIGLLAYEARRAFGPAKVFEIDSTSTPPAETASAALAAILERRGERTRIDWTAGYGSARRLRSLLSA
jgi:adenylate kinase